MGIWVRDLRSFIARDAAILRGSDGDTRCKVFLGRGGATWKPDQEGNPRKPVELRGGSDSCPSGHTHEP